MEVGGQVETIQTTALIRTARILRRVLETGGDLLSLKVQWKTSANTDVKNTKGVNNNNNNNNNNITNKPRIVPWRKERMLQRIQRHSRVTLHRSTHPKWKQDQTKKPSHGLDWQQKGIWYGSAKLDNKLSQYVQDITWRHKHHRENLENLQSGASSRREKLGWNKDPKRDFSRRHTIILTIHNCHDATERHAQKMHSRIKT